MLDVRRMRVLREVAQRGSFSAAAEALSFTQSAVSQQIAALEREAGAVLVERSARGVRLTEAGEAVVRHTEAILARLGEAEAELEALAGLRGGRLRLAAFESAAATVMPLAIARFTKAHPAVELSMSLMEPEDALPAMRAGESTSPSRSAPATPATATRTASSTCTCSRTRCTSSSGADHPLARKRAIRLADLAGEAWIGGPADCECNRLISRACLRAGFDPRIAFETDDYAAVQGFVAAGVGVSIIAELGLRTVRDDIVVRPLGRETPVRQIFVSVVKGYRSPATAAMVDVLRDVGAGHAERRPALELVSSARHGRAGVRRRPAPPSAVDALDLVHEVEPVLRLAHRRGRVAAAREPPQPHDVGVEDARDGGAAGAHDAGAEVRPGAAEPRRRGAQPGAVARRRAELGLEVEVVEVHHRGRHGRVVEREEAGDHGERAVGGERHAQERRGGGELRDPGGAVAELGDLGGGHARGAQLGARRAVRRGLQRARGRDDPAAPPGERIVDRVLGGRLHVPEGGRDRPAARRGARRRGGRRRGGRGRGSRRSGGRPCAGRAVPAVAPAAGGRRDHRRDRERGAAAGGPPPGRAPRREGVGTTVGWGRRGHGPCRGGRRAGLTSPLRSA